MSQRGPGKYLVVTIDTEEEGLWSGNYAKSGTVQNIQEVPCFQQVCDRWNIRPTYLITTPVAESEDAVRILRAIMENDRCEIGTHVHPWNSPPFGKSEKATTGKSSYLCNLPKKIQFAKLEKLTELIETQFGRRPITFRAGRYGADQATIDCLRELDYRVDSSVLPGADYRYQGGPDFRHATRKPYLPSANDICQAGGAAGLLEIPITSGFTHRHFELATRLRSIAFLPPWRQLRCVGILDRLGIATKVKLSPEQASLSQMKKLTRAALARTNPILILMFHSSSLLPGCSPYVRSAGDRKLFLNKLNAYFEFALSELALETIDLGSCYRIFDGPQRATPQHG